MAITFDISPTLTLETTDSRARTLDISDYFLCVNGGAANSIITDNPLNDTVIVEEGDEIALDETQIGTNPVVKDKDGNDITSICLLPPDPPIEGAKVLGILPIGGGNGDICVGYDDLDGGTGYIEDDEGNTTIGFSTSCREIVTFEQPDFNGRGCYGKITINPLKLEGSLEFKRERPVTEETNGVVRRIKTYEVYQLRLLPMTEKIALLLINHIRTGRVRINGMEFTKIGAVDMNNDVNELWVVDIELERFLCDENIC